MGIKDITDHKESLRKDGSDDSLRRLEWLNTKTAVLKLGANSESELSYKLLKAKDAVSACKWALDSGIVVGGGKSLLQTSEAVKGTIFEEALCSPHAQLVENNDMQRLDTTNVWDSTIVIKNAVKNAVSLAGIILTTGADIRLRDKTKEEQEIEILTLKNRPF